MPREAAPWGLLLKPLVLREPEQGCAPGCQLRWDRPTKKPSLPSCPPLQNPHQHMSPGLPSGVLGRQKWEARLHPSSTPASVSPWGKGRPRRAVAGRLGTLRLDPRASAAELLVPSVHLIALGALTLGRSLGGPGLARAWSTSGVR